MVCSVPGPDGLQTHFDQLREYTQASNDEHITCTVKLITSDRPQPLGHISSWSSATECFIKEELSSDSQPVCVCVCLYEHDK